MYYIASLCLFYYYLLIGFSHPIYGHHVIKWWSITVAISCYHWMAGLPLGCQKVMRWFLAMIYFSLSLSLLFVSTLIPCASLDSIRYIIWYILCTYDKFVILLCFHNYFMNILYCLCPIFNLMCKVHLWCLNCLLWNVQLITIIRDTSWDLWKDFKGEYFERAVAWGIESVILYNKLSFSYHNKSLIEIS